jgi:C-terminal processing protease CtpA/Prc
MLSDTDVEDHYSPSVRLINLERNGSNCGFQLTRGKWDPYPWVNSVASDTAADLAGIKPGDCLLEVNGEDILGQRITEVAEIVKSKPNQVSLLLWNAGVDSQCTPEVNQFATISLFNNSFQTSTKDPPDFLFSGFTGN